MKRILFILLVLISLFSMSRLWMGNGSIHDYLILEKRVAAQTTEIQELESRNKVLKAEIQNLKTNVQAFEERARLEHGMIKPGETFYLIVEPLR